jgi:hypothetical protein
VDHVRSTTLDIAFAALTETHPRQRRRTSDQLAYARGGFAPTTRSACARRWKDAAQKQADALMKPYVEHAALKLPE